MIEFLKLDNGNYNIVDEPLGLVGQIIFDSKQYWFQPEKDVDYSSLDLLEISTFMFKINP